MEDGIVTLTGSVQRSSQRTDAEQVVRSVIGSRRLVNHIRVFPVTRTESLSEPESSHRRVTFENQATAAPLTPL